ncbi:AsnC family transcriptional regulator [Streptomyces parvulus]|uniref:Lrp/AsnC family transcriptional regulator n=1 Tax=Streptomyces parvulus TaxID=146923 RepID=UPI0036E18AE6
MPESIRMDEQDLALVDALQLQPRAPWTDLGRVLGVNASTVARRWERLSSSGLAWMAAYPQPADFLTARVEVRCAAGTAPLLAEALADEPWIYSIDLISGSYEMLLSVAAPDAPSLVERVSTRVGRSPHVRRTSTSFVLRIYRESHQWLAHALGQEQMRTLRAGRPPASRRPDVRPDAQLGELLDADPRASVAELSERTGLSASTVRRRLKALEAGSAFSIRCDIAQAAAGWPVIALLKAQVPPAHLNSVAREVAALPGVRTCYSVTGRANLAIQLWLHTQEQILEAEAELDAAFEQLTILDRTVVHWSYKRLGRVLEPSGVVRGKVPLALGEAIVGDRTADRPTTGG